MDMMIRRRLLEQMAGGGNSQCKEGTFTGNGTKTTTISIGFEPDVLVIESDLDPSVAWGGGVGFIAFIKNRATLNYYHNSDTATAWTATVLMLDDNSNPYGEGGTGSYRSIGTYQNGSFTIDNITNNYRVNLVSGTTYRWKAYKKN